MMEVGRQCLAVKEGNSEELTYSDFVIGLGRTEKFSRGAIFEEEKSRTRMAEAEDWNYFRFQEVSKTELIMTVIDGKPTCTVCKKTFSSRGCLKTHCNIHTREKVYSCSVCDKRYSQSGGLAEHKRLHTGEKYSCTECGKQLTRKCNLVVHQRIHAGIKPYSCADCPAKFTVKKDLGLHVMIHMPNRPYHFCAECPAKYKCPKSLITHKRKMHYAATL